MNPNYRTLHKDIGLIQRSNNGWDLWFDNGDTVKAEDFHSLQVGIIVACLTSWNYMNRYGNPTYEVFGNRAYELLKANKNGMVAYKIQQYFLECLKRMRRVYEVVSLNVSEISTEPYTYFVEFEVISISNQLVDGSFTVSTVQGKSTSYIEYELYTPYASNKFPLQIDLYLKNEYGGGLEDEILYMYVQEGDDEPTFEVVGKTDRNGFVRVVYSPKGENSVNNVHFVFGGNTTYNGVVSEYKSFETEQVEYVVEFTDEPMITSDRFVDLHLLLRKHSLVTGLYSPLANTELVITGDDGSFYTCVTDELGEASVRVKSTKHTLYTVTYDDVSDSISVLRERFAPTVELEFVESNIYGEMVYDVLLFDGVGERVVDNLDDLMIHIIPVNSTGSYPVTFNSNGVGRVSIPRELVIENEYSFRVESTSTDYYVAIDTVIDDYRRSVKLVLDTKRISQQLTRWFAYLYDEDDNPILEHLDDLRARFVNSRNVEVSNNKVLVLNGIATGNAMVVNQNLTNGWVCELNGNDYYKPVSEWYGNLHDYSVSFGESVYTATDYTVSTGGSATLSLTLTDNGVPVSNANVTVTGGGNDYTVTTDSDGVGSVTVSNVRSDTTFTASYNGVTGNCTVRIPVINVSFEESSYVAMGGSVRIYLSVTMDNVPVPNVIVRIKESGVVKYSCATNSNGVGSFNASTDVDTVLVADYRGVTDECIVTVPTYSVEFGESSYEAVDGSATLSVRLLADGVGFMGNVRVTGSDSSIYNVITDSNGVGTVNVRNISTTTTFTASFKGVTDECVVTVPVYSLVFSSSSYEAVNGVATLSLTLLGDGVAVPNANVTVSGSDGSVYTSITNSNGIGTCNVNVSADTTFTATYSNVSDNCIVTVPTSPYLFYDECNSASGLSNYTNPVTVRGSGNCTLAYDSNGYYTTKITGTTAFQVLYPIIPLDGKNIHKFTVELYPQTGTNNGAGLCIFNDTNNFFSLYTNYQNRIYETSRLNGNEIDTSRGSCSVMNKWQKYEYILENGRVTLNVYDLSDNRVFTTTQNLRITIGSSTKIGITQTWQTNNVVRIRNIKVE